MLRADLDVDSLVVMLHGAVLVNHLRFGEVGEAGADRILAALRTAIT